MVGILKLTFALLLLIGIERKPFAIAGGLGIAFLMGCAFIIHLRVKNPWFKMLPSLTLLVLSLTIAVINYRLLNARCRAAQARKRPRPLPSGGLLYSYGAVRIFWVVADCIDGWRW